MILIDIKPNITYITYHLLYPSLDFRKIGLFTFFKEPKLLKELTPMPPKVKTGIFVSV
jgi:hypothetical protein